MTYISVVKYKQNLWHIKKRPSIKRTETLNKI